MASREFAASSAPIDIPTTAGELTPDLLTALLRSAGHAITIESVTATPVGTGQMAGSYRLNLTYRGESGLPDRMIAKLATGPKEQREFGSGAFRNEVRFYRDLATTVRVPVPRCHASLVSDTGSEFLLLLDDLAPAEQGDQIGGCTVAQARAVALAAAGLHGPRWCDESLLREPGLALPTASDRELMESVLTPMTSAFRDRFSDLLTEPEQALLDWLEDTAGEWLVRPLEHFALMHGDLRVDNVMFGPDGSTYVIDWQTITPGNALRDIAFLLSTSLTVADRRAAEDAILADYHRALLDHGVTGYSVEQCRRDYAESLIQAPLIIVFGCGAAAATERGDRMFHTMLTRSAAAVGDLLPEALR